VWVRILEIDEARRRISLSIKRAQPSQNLPLRDLIPPELSDEVEAALAEVPNLEDSDDAFPETGEAADPPAPEPQEEPAPEASGSPGGEEPGASS